MKSRGSKMKPATGNKMRTNYELAKSMRGSWNGVVPVTRIFSDKKKYTRKEKHPKRYF